MQLLRGEGVHDLTLSNFSLTGPGGDGERLGHGLLQITGGKGIHLENLHISAADADGLAIAQAEDCTVEGVSVTGASKSAIYLADCSDSFVRKNTVSDFGGHYLGDGVQVGVGIQLSSCRNVHCTDNLIQEGLGVGILCNAFQGGSKPMGVTLTGNKIRGVSNHDNRNVSGGIRLANGSGDKLTRTQVSGNSIWDCGENGIYIENHGGSEVTGNFLSASLGVGIQVSTIEDVRITNNVIFDSGVGRERPTEPFALINSSHGVHLEGNVTDSPGQVPATED